MIPATLATLWVFGHSPLQLLLIGAYAVTVYLLNFEEEEEADRDSTREATDWLEFVINSALEGEQSSLQRDGDQESPASPLRFLELIKWLDGSPLAPLLNERTMVFLYRVSNALDAIGEAGSSKSGSDQ